MFSDHFYHVLDPVVESFPKIPVQTRRFFAGMLTLQEQIMRASEHLLLLASTKHPFFDEHIDEERGHGLWIRDDMRGLYLEWHDQPLFPEVPEMVGAQYYHILHGDPMALFGYLGFLEGYPMPPEHVQIIKELYPASCSTIEHHAKHDVAHRKELRYELDMLAPKHHTAVLDNALKTAQLYQLALWRILTQ